jgi:heme exporter protein CcmD
MMQQFLTWASMGKYAAYVWPSFGLTLLVVILNIHWARRSFREAREIARRRLAMRRSET